MSLFTEQDHARLATLFGGVWTPDGTTWAGPYPGYKPEVREAPNGDTKACPDCGGACEVPNGNDRMACGTCAAIGRVPNVDAGPAGKRYLHVAPKYNPPEWAMAYLARAHYEACRVAEALGVPPEYYPRVADGTLRVLEYPSAAHRHVPESPFFCDECGQQTHELSTDEPLDDGVCPALAPGAGTVEHTDPDLFSIVLWRSTPEDLSVDRFPEGYRGARNAALCMSPGLHIGEIGELVGLGPATPHRVPARPYPQRSIVYFAVPDHGAPLECECPRPDLHGHRPYTYKTEPQARCTGTTVGAWLAERLKRSRY